MFNSNASFEFTCKTDFQLFYYEDLAVHITDSCPPELGSLLADVIEDYLMEKCDDL